MGQAALDRAKANLENEVAPQDGLVCQLIEEVLYYAQLSGW